MDINYDTTEAVDDQMVDQVANLIGQELAGAGLVTDYTVPQYLEMVRRLARRVLHNLGQQRLLVPRQLAAIVVADEKYTLDDLHQLHRAYRRIAAEPIPLAANTRRWMSVDVGLVSEPTRIALGWGLPGVDPASVQITLNRIPTTTIAGVILELLDLHQPTSGEFDTTGIGLPVWQDLQRLNIDCGGTVHFPNTWGRRPGHLKGGD